MTIEEAIAELKEDIALYIPTNGTIEEVDRELPDGRLITALEMAIKALEKQPCEDCISRQAVLDAMSHTWKHICFVARRKQPTKGEKAVYFDMCGAVRQIPSVTPQQKTGRWVYELEDWNKWTCSECGWSKRADVHVRLGYNYCPNCGARMEECE